MDEKISALIELVRTRKVSGHKDIGDSWDLSCYNTPERLDAAEELAELGVVEAREAMEYFFVESALNLNTSHEYDSKGLYNFGYVGDMRELVGHYLKIADEAAFSRMMLEEVIPGLEREMETNLDYYSDDYVREIYDDKMSKLVENFGHVGGWLSVVQEKQAAEEAARMKVENDRIDGIKKARESEKLCVMCGQPLGFMQKMFGLKRHGSCDDFIED